VRSLTGTAARLRWPPSPLAIRLLSVTLLGGVLLALHPFAHGERGSVYVAAAGLGLGLLVAPGLSRALLSAAERVLPARLTATNEAVTGASLARAWRVARGHARGARVISPDAGDSALDPQPAALQPGPALLLVTLGEGTSMLYGVEGRAAGEELAAGLRADGARAGLVRLHVRSPRVATPGKRMRLSAALVVPALLLRGDSTWLWIGGFALIAILLVTMARCAWDFFQDMTSATLLEIDDAVLRLDEGSAIPMAAIERVEHGVSAVVIHYRSLDFLRPGAITLHPLPGAFGAGASLIAAIVEAARASAHGRRTAGGAG
jgi:hypothetical protein